MRIGLAVIMVALLGGGAAAAEGDPDKPKSHVTVSFAGGALAPVGDMADNSDLGLAVMGRLGWTGVSGLGLVVNLEYAPLRRDGQDLLTDIDSHMFVASAAPRFTLGHKVLRMWVAAGGGLIIERVKTTTSSPLGVITNTDLDTVAALNGSAGLDLHFFANGGLSIAGAYTRSLSNDSVYDYFTITAGLVFTM